jgi:hypothetical protein
MGIKDFLDEAGEVLDSVGDFGVDIRENVDKDIGTDSTKGNREEAKGERERERKTRSEVEVLEQEHEKQRWEDHPDEHTVEIPDHGHRHPGRSGSSIIIDRERETEYEDEDGNIRSKRSTEREEIRREGGERDDVVYDQYGRERPRGDYEVDGNLGGSEAAQAFLETYNTDEYDQEEIDQRAADIVTFVNQKTGSNIQFYPFEEGSGDYATMWAQIAERMPEIYSEEQMAAFESRAAGAWKSFSNEATDFAINLENGGSSQGIDVEKAPSESKNSNFQVGNGSITAGEIEAMHEAAAANRSAGNIENFERYVNNLAHLYPNTELADRLRNGQNPSYSSVADATSIFIEEYAENPVKAKDYFANTNLAGMNAFAYLSDEAVSGEVAPYVTSEQPTPAPRERETSAPETSGELTEKDITNLYIDLKREGKEKELDALVTNLAVIYPDSKLGQAMSGSGNIADVQWKDIADTTQQFIDDNVRNRDDAVRYVKEGNIDKFTAIVDATEAEANKYQVSREQEPVARNEDVPEQQTAADTNKRVREAVVASEPEATSSQDASNETPAPAPRQRPSREETVVASEPEATPQESKVAAIASNTGRVSFEEAQLMFDEMAAQRGGATNVIEALAGQGIMVGVPKAMMAEYMNSLGHQRDPEIIASALDDASVRNLARKEQDERQATVSGENEAEPAKAVANTQASSQGISPEVANAVKGVNFGSFAEGISYSLFDPASDTVAPSAAQGDKAVASVGRS